MPFGQRSLIPDSGVALRANFLAMDNDLKIIRVGIRMTSEHVHRASAIPPSFW
jgi:hypothetical protein